MVFESVLTQVLNSVLGDYVENLDRNQLNVGIWGGKESNNVHIMFLRMFLQVMLN